MHRITRSLHTVFYTLYTHCRLPQQGSTGSRLTGRNMGPFVIHTSSRFKLLAGAGGFVTRRTDSVRQASSTVRDKVLTNCKVRSVIRFDGDLEAISNNAMRVVACETRSSTVPTDYLYCSPLPGQNHLTDHLMSPRRFQR